MKDAEESPPLTPAEDYGEDNIWEILTHENSVSRLRQAIDEGFDPKVHLGYSGDALALAVQCKNVDAIKLLLAEGVSPNWPSGIFGRTALWYASDSVEITRLLLANGADIKGSWALHSAAAHLELDTITCLLHHGADPNEKANEEMTQDRLEAATPLHSAMEPRGVNDADGLRHVEIVQCLLNAGADVRIVDENGATAMDLARSDGNLPNVLALLSSWEESHPA